MDNTPSLIKNVVPTSDTLVKSSEKYKEIIAALPRVERKGESNMCQYQGMTLPPERMGLIMSAQENFKGNPNDIVLCSFPKSGTGWLKSLAFAILTRSKHSGSEHPLLSKSAHALVPFLENDLWDISPSRDPDLPLLGTHITYPALPTSIISSGCKIVYIWRDLKDVIVSFYHFYSKILAASKRESKININDLFEQYCHGISPYGPYWDHVLGYWKASLEFPEKVLFLKFEDIKKDPISNVRKLAEFMGYPFDQEEEKSGGVQRVVELCSIETVSNLEANKTGVLRSDLGATIPNDCFVRKGVVGDWRNYFTTEMGERLDQIVQEKLSPFGLSVGTCPSELNSSI